MRGALSSSRVHGVLLATTLLATVRGYGKIHALVTRGVTRVLEEPVRWRCLQDNRSTQMQYSWAETVTACYISRKRSSQVGRRQKKRPPRWTALRFPVVFRSSSTLVVHSTRIHLGLAANKPLAIRNKNMVAKRTFKSANKGKAIRLCRNSHYGTSVRRGFRF